MSIGAEAIKLAGCERRSWSSLWHLARTCPGGMRSLVDGRKLFYESLRSMFCALRDFSSLPLKEILRSSREGWIVRAVIRLEPSCFYEPERPLV